MPRWQISKGGVSLALLHHCGSGQYNPAGDGRGFYGQARGTDGELYDFQFKGSGTTPILAALMAD